ncbi:MFS transporter [Paenibacillus donghaensis]|uniref:MFS transporter n=1 Tax=Paenibacillus donghaensis TaxID=414771 RepID=A0A2Z2KN88_9BACL|nr:MFS transporter [Paenibacillus donghaensis]ASA24069.1 MFS transporter [Paenibacillus donghaensis]
MSKLSTNRFPWLGLLALAMNGFIAIMTETLPAGLLPQIKEGLQVSEALAGQLVTLYAVGSLVAAIPVAVLTGGWRRRPLLLLSIIGFLIFNTITALSTNYGLTLVVRFFAGVSAGVSWGLIASYALRMVPDHLKGRGMAVAMIGTPIALSFGVPAGTLIGSFMGWRSAFWLMSLLAFVLIFWVLWKVPDFPGQAADKRNSAVKVLRTPGIIPILIVVFTWMLAHNILYTFIAPFLKDQGLESYVGLILLVFGVMALVGIWIIGVLIDRWLRPLVLISLTGFALLSLVLGIWSEHGTIVFISVALWGLTFGGAATLLQTALAQAAGEQGVDLVMPINTTVWNLAIAGGGVFGGVLLNQWGTRSFPWALLLLLLVALLVAWRAKTHGFRSSQL